MPIDILIYAVVAVAMIFWLKNVIGTRHGSERQRPNPFEKKDTPKSFDDGLDAKSSDRIALPIQSKPTQSSGKTGFEHGNVDAGLVQIALADKSFNANDFKENAMDAFSIIVTAFAEGERDTLRDLCSPDVYKAFDYALREREAKGETVSTEIHSVRKADIVDAGVDNKKTAFVTIRFTADETYVISDANGNILAGHPDRVTEMTDKWTFSRSVKSNDPRWFLSKTDDDVVEADGKTPLPDAG